MTAARPRTVSLGHLHVPLPDPVAAFAAPKKVMAWDGGKITTNKEEATLIFLRKKQARGEVLTSEQLVIIEKFSLGSDRTALPEGGATPGTAPVSKKDRKDVLKKLEAAAAAKRKESGKAEDEEDDTSNIDTAANGGLTTKRFRKKAGGANKRQGGGGGGQGGAKRQKFGKGGGGGGKGGGKGKGGSGGRSVKGR
eukprot:CAMPEP_0119542140 /NCGR_PEP_ID=MMETSP1344-20130328/53398_1 /TAXON_ID=236787 /ORGANISM="Florenciella parvula, Strain CCMP2471" /LENGTH=194 /DNA_ID=CAMNT_0007586289 /DNA_START=27 /DNA_END=608 /DNA_ORIENTATION=-